MHDIYKNRSQNLKETQQKELFEKYGGEEHLEAPREIIFAQNDNYVEYSRDGRVLKGRERAYEKSKYEEDIMVGNHSSVWGSWFDVGTGKFGFKCCKQTLKNSYCIPQKRQETLADVPGEEAAAEEADEGGDDDIVEFGGQVPESSSDSDSSSSASGEVPPEVAAKKKAEAEEKRKARALKGLRLANKEKEAAKGTSVADIAAAAAAASKEADSSSKLGEKRSSAFGHVLEEVTEFNQTKVDEARNAEKKRRKTVQQGMSLDDERNRKYSSLAGDSAAGELSPEEYEAYRLERSRADDPMAQFK